jgi:hypothetical protein
MVANQRGHHQHYHSHFRLIHDFLHKMLPLHRIANTRNSNITNVNSPKARYSKILAHSGET